MSLLIEHKTEKRTLTFFLPPSRADRFKYFDDEKPYLSYFIGSETFREYFLKGTVFIGLTSEVTEEQCKMMVDEILPGRFENYYDKNSLTSKFGNAKRSFESIIQHIMIDDIFKKWIVLFKPND